MRKRVDGDNIVLMDESGAEVLTAHVNGDTVTVRHDDWVLIKETAQVPAEIIRRLATENVPGIRFRFYDLILELRSNIALMMEDFGSIYSRFIEETEEHPDLIIHALSADDRSPLPYAMIMEPACGKGLRLKGDFSAVTYLSSLDYLLLQVHSEVETFAIINNPNHMFIHGGAVEKEGMGYVLPAESGCGKTTLTLALVNAGYRFMSDEFAILEAISGTLLPFPRTLSVREDSLRLFADLHRDRDNLPILYSPKEVLYSVDPIARSGVTPGEQCSVRYVIFPHYDPSSEPSMKPISRMSALSRLVATQSCLSLGTADKQTALDLILSVVSQAECFELVTGDLQRTTALVNELSQ